ncbi:MAG TPA: sulfatase [Myxococcota bacterium]|nr:sulfatase [Myxococcota bacterium]
MNTHVRAGLALFVVANIAVFAFLLLRPPEEPAEDLGAILDPMVADGTMETARYDLSDKAGELNVILISLDALRYDRTGLSGNSDGLTPNLDAFVEEAIVFDNAVSAASWTLPSHMSMWTGRWPSVHGVTNKLRLLGADQMAESALSAGIETYPSLLVRDGMVAAGFSGGAGMSGRYGFARDFSVYVDDRPFAGLDYSAPQAVDWLREHRDERFLLVVHGYDVHGQYPLPPATADGIEYAGDLDGTVEENARLREQGLAAIVEPGDASDITGDVGADDARFLEELYDLKVRAADERLGSLLSQIRTMGLMDNSIIAVVSDHGDEFMEHGALDHGHTLYEEQLHVVMALRIPGYARQQRIPDIVRTVDLFPTVFDLLGLPGPEGVNGVSLLPLLRGEPMELEAYSETDYRLFVHQRALRQGDYKLILDLRDGERSLYDLSADSEELRDISSGEPRRTYEMEQELKGWMMQHGQNPQDYLGIRQNPIEIF